MNSRRKRVPILLLFLLLLVVASMNFIIIAKEEEKEKEPKTFLVAVCEPEWDDERDVNIRKAGYNPGEHSRFMANYFARHVFPERILLTRPCYSSLETIPPEFSHTEDADYFLGVSDDVDLRICRFGSTDVLEYLKKRKHAVLRDVTRFSRFGKVVQRTTAKSRVVTQLVDERTGLPVGPLFFRQTSEPWDDEPVPGIPMQIDTRFGFVSGAKTPRAFLPYVVDSFAARSRTLQRNYSPFQRRLARADTFEEAMRRSNVRYRNDSLRFAGMVASNCGVHSRRTPGTYVRDAFVYAMREFFNATIDAAGRCPLDTARLGMTPYRRDALSRRFAERSTSEFLANYRFAIVFENTFDALGYVTEKIVSAYMTPSTVPVYAGPPLESFSEFLNPKAFIYCPIPATTTFLRARSAEFLVNDDDDDFVDFVRRRYEKEFAACLATIKEVNENATKRDEIFAQDLMPPRSETWSGERLGRTVREIFVGLGYDERRRFILRRS